jgi:hypothetical protein
VLLFPKKNVNVRDIYPFINALGYLIPANKVFHGCVGCGLCAIRQM